MRRPSAKRLFLFVVMSVAYACLAGLVLAASSISTCSMQPDVAATCDATSIVIVMVGLGLLYVAGAVWFFGAKLDGVD